MNNSSWIDKLTLHNFRCHPNVEINNFKRFNLVFGRNGSGKTSMLEAIEIALTGASSRINSGVSLKDVCSRDRMDKLAIKVSVGGQDFSSFESSLSPSPSVVLKKLFNIDASGQKARYLLPQMFLTHNLLYSERIVQFLGADTQKDIEEVLAELTVGRDVMDKWKSLLEGKKVAVSALKSAEMFENELEIEIEDVENRIKSVSETLNTNLMEQIQNYNNKTNAAQMNPSLLLPSDIDIEEIHKAAVSLESHTSHGLKLLDEIETMHSKLPSMYKTLSSDGAIGSLNELNAVAQSMKDTSANLILEIEKLGNIAGLLNRRTYKYKQKCDQLDEYRIDIDKIIRCTATIIEWFPEISASKNSQGFYTDIASLKEVKSKTQNLLLALNRLPELAEVQKTLSEIQTISEKVTIERRHLNELLIQNKELAGILEEKNKQLSFSKHSEIDKYRTLIDVLSSLEVITNKCDSTSCPTCGHIWPNKNELVAVIQARKEMFLQQLGQTEGDINLMTEIKKIEADIAKISIEESVKSSELQSMDQQSNKLMQMISKYRLLIKDVKSQLNNNGFPFNVQDENLIETILEGERLRLAAIKKDQENDVHISAIETKLQGLWGGLRSQEFESKRDDLRLSYNHIKTSTFASRMSPSSELDLALLEKLSTNLLSVEKKVNTAIDSIKQRIVKLSNKLVLYNSNISVTKEQLTKNDHVLSIKISESQLLTDYINKYNDFEMLGYCKVLPLDFINEKKSIGNISNELTTIRITASDNIRSLSEMNQLKQHHLEKIRHKDKIHFKVKSLRQNIHKFDKLLDPKEVETKIWNEYLTSITTIFTKLHWPPDFKNVNFSLENNGLNIKVLPKGHTNEVAASDRLSAGQRAALALSIFWSMNVMTENVPNIMLMDEPIQNVDDLNVLNFLDGLRTLIEKRNYQVFLTTANSKISALVRKKFSYLGDDFLEMKVSRFGKVSSFECLDGYGNNTSNFCDAIAQ